MTTTRNLTTDLDQRLVSGVMRAGVVGCTPDTPLTEVARLMAEHRIHCVVVGGLQERRHGTRLARVLGDHDVAHLVVVDETGAEPVGVVSTLDVARAFAELG